MSIADLLDDRFPIRIPAAATTLVGFRAWVTSDEFPEKWRATYINGEVLLDMSPEETETHNKVKSAVYLGLWRLSQKNRLGTVYVDGVQLSNETAGLSTVPDAMYVSRERLRSGRVKRVQRTGRFNEYVEMEGSPDIVVEVVSRSSRKKDTEELPGLYYRAGIAEYWLIDALGDEIDFCIFRRGGRHYVPVDPIGGWLTADVFGRRVKLVRTRDEDGDWQYELKVKK